MAKMDLRVLKTQKNIKTALCNLLVHKAFKDITVQNICDKALVSRSTFYDHYYDKYDLLSKIAEEIISEFKPYLKHRFNLNPPDSFISIGAYIIKYFSENKNIIQALFSIHNESIDIYNDFKAILIQECSSYLKRENFISKFNVSNDYICAHYASYVLTSFELWLKLGENDADFRLANKFQAILFESST
ncbi:AcrR family transcriptional regulator [Clostridium acetobutylicum]|nr:Transcriptional regulator, AcrR family [Clostridium acetobutylicum EA 2018]NOV87500.1 AcrR family transcriptional regulator [Clostridium acetobutylicum]NOW14158.1 AcrR family transcriptional regulator [Clostridium acetobutylicum]NRY58172.1 AcrR family transcriptional regulator [Clostridium acetobutylicum]NSA91623.1 AcrR family transcriptional regulator [Clostridium acetobutylicum]